MEKSGKHRYTLRDIQTGEIICADLTAGEVYRITGIPSQQVNKYWQRGTIRDSIWKVDLYEEGDEGIWTPELCMRWDCIRKMVLSGLKHSKGTYEEKIERWRNRASKEDDDEICCENYNGDRYSWQAE